MNIEMPSYFEDPEFKEALAKYEDMVENNTSAYFDADELTEIAEYYAYKIRVEDAEKVIDLALQLHPNDMGALIFRARSLALKDNMEEAWAIVSQLEEITSNREVKFLKADFLMDEDRVAEADEILQQLAVDEGNELDTLLDILQDYTEINLEEYAAKWLAILADNYDLTVLSDKNQRLRDILCDYYTTFNQPAMALPLLRTTLDEDPYSIEHWNEQGKCQILLGEYEAAHESLDFASAIDDKNTETIALKAFCFRQSGNLTEACKYYLHLAQVSGDITRPYMALAEISLNMDAYESAMFYTETLLTSQSKLTNYERAEVYCNAAVCHAAFRQFDKGYEYIYKAIHLNEYDPDMRIAAGRFFLTIAQKTEDEVKEKKSLASAANEFVLALQLAPEDERFDTLLSIATTCFDTHNYDYANRYFELINQEFPTRAKVTYYFMLYCYFQMNQQSLFMHVLAKIKTEIPEIYANFGTNRDLSRDTHFNELLRNIKDNISDGKIDINKYL